MKHLIWLAILLPFCVQAQVNGTIQRTVATKTIRYFNSGAAGIDTIENKHRAVFVEDYGNTEASIQSAINAAGANGVVILEPGRTYIQSNGLVIRSAGVEIIGGGATIQRGAQSTTTLSVAATQASTSISVASVPSGWKVGDRLQIYTDSTFVTSNGGIGSKITGISGTTITLFDNVGTTSEGLNKTWPIGSIVRKVYIQLTAELLDTAAKAVATKPLDIKVSGLTFDGNKANNKGNYYWAVNSALNTNGHSTITENTFKDMPNENLLGTGFIFNNNQVRNTNGSFVHFGGAGGREIFFGQVSGNNVYNTNLQNTTTTTGHSEGAITFSFSAGRSIITNNWIQNTNSSAILGRFTSSAADGNLGTREFIFSNNYVKNSIAIKWQFLSSGASTYKVGRFTISNNVLDSCGVNDWTFELANMDPIQATGNTLIGGTTLILPASAQILQGTATGNVTSVTGTANQITVTGTTAPVISLPATITGLTSVTSTGFTGALTGNASTATTAGTVTTAAQPAITSVGTLTGLTVTNPITGSVTGSAASITGSLAGDVAGTQSATVVGKINGVSLAGLTTGILKNTTTTGVPSIAIAADFPTLNQNTTGNASTATALQTGRLINGVPFNGTVDITVPAAAGTLSGNTLAASVVTSSLTSVGTLVNLTVTNPISGSITGNAATATTAGTVTTNANLTGAITSVGNSTSLGSFSSANLLGALTNETGTGSAVFATSPTFTGTITGSNVNLSGTHTNTLNVSQTSGSTNKFHLGQFLDASFLSNNWFFNGVQSYDDNTKGSASVTLGEGTISLATAVANTPPVAAMSIASNQNVTFSANISASNLTSGTYTPTLTNTTNVTSSTPYQCFYTRVGNIVTVSGFIEAITTVGGAAVLGVSLPIASNFASSRDVAGAGSVNSSVAQNVILNADLTNDRAVLILGIAGALTQAVYFTFSYTVI